MHNVDHSIVLPVLGLLNGVGIVIVVSPVVPGSVEEIRLSGCGLVLNNGSRVHMFLCGATLACGNRLPMLITDAAALPVWITVDSSEASDAAAVEDIEICGDPRCT